MSKQLLFAVVSTASALLLAGCGGGGGSSSGGGGAPVGVSVATNPTSPVLDPNAPPVASLQLSPSNPFVATGQAVVVSALGLAASGRASAHQISLTWTTSNPNVVSIGGDPAGDYYARLVTGLATGTATIIAKDNISGFSASVVVTVQTPSGGTGQPPGAGPAPGGGPAPNPTGGPVTNPGPGPTPPSPLKQSTSVYFNDFETSVDPHWTFNGAPFAQFATAPKGQRFLGEFPMGKATLSLANLPTHSSLTVSYKLYIIRSWDGNSSHNGPDLFDMTVDGLGQPLLNTTFSNIDAQLAGASGFPDGFAQAFPDNFAGTDVLQHPLHTGAAAVNTLGYTFSSDPADATYTLTYTFSHTSDAVAINWESKQTEPIDNESWGLDDVQVVANP